MIPSQRSGTSFAKEFSFVTVIYRYWEAVEKTFKYLGILDLASDELVAHQSRLIVTRIWPADIGYQSRFNGMVTNKVL